MSRTVIVVTAFAVLAIAAVFVIGGRAQAKWSQATDDNCERIHRVVVAGQQILDGESQLRYAQEHQMISRTEFDEQLERLRRFRPLTERQLAIWRSADCVPSNP